MGTIITISGARRVFSAHGGGTETVLRVERSGLLCDGGTSDDCYSQISQRNYFPRQTCGDRDFCGTKFMRSGIRHLRRGSAGTADCVARGIPRHSSSGTGAAEPSRIYFRSVGLMDPSGSWYHIAAVKYLAKNAYGPADEFFSMR